jgi:hypothetical protein
MTAHRLLCLVLLSGYLSAAPPASPARGAANSLTVCELFEHLPRYNGRVITGQSDLGGGQLRDDGPAGLGALGRAGRVWATRRNIRMAWSTR